MEAADSARVSISDARDKEEPEYPDYKTHTIMGLCFYFERTRNAITLEDVMKTYRFF
jgi:hypothetical protein